MVNSRKRQLPYENVAFLHGLLQLNASCIAPLENEAAHLNFVVGPIKAGEKPNTDGYSFHENARDQS